MVDTSEYLPSEGGEYINVTVVRNSPTKLGVVLPGTGYREFDNDGVKVEKPYITVEMDGRTYEWTMSPTANQSLGQELGYETDAWVGAAIKFLELKAGNQAYVSATVITKPKPKPKAEPAGEAVV